MSPFGPLPVVERGPVVGKAVLLAKRDTDMTRKLEGDTETPQATPARSKLPGNFTERILDEDQGPTKDGTCRLRAPGTAIQHPGTQKQQDRGMECPELGSLGVESIPAGGLETEAFLGQHLKATRRLMELTAGQQGLHHAAGLLAAFTRQVQNGEMRLQGPTPHRRQPERMHAIFRRLFHDVPGHHTQVAAAALRG